jgi:hypothetical protein
MCEQEKKSTETETEVLVEKEREIVLGKTKSLKGSDTRKTLTAAIPLKSSTKSGN